MQNRKFDDNSSYDYRGKRAVILLRVSTEEQEKKYGFPSQLRAIREKVIEPYGLRVPDGDKYIKRDTYTGMEFREREVLAEILEMAKRREFDVLVMDVLDRLGRVGLPREIYRAELGMYGIRTLTTKPEEHADDDSLMGQMIRLLHGFKSEEERNDILRRTQNGKRERVLKDKKLLGTPNAKYGWKFADATNGSYIPNNDPLIVGGTVLYDEKGEPWTEAKVRRHMFHLVDEGVSLRKITLFLTSQHIPTGSEGQWNVRLVQRIIDARNIELEGDPVILAYGCVVVLDENNQPYTRSSIAKIVYELDDKGIKAANIAKILNQKKVPTGKEACWSVTTVSYMLSDEFVIGKAAVFMYRTMKEGGKRYVEKLPKDQWIYLPDGVVPPLLVTEDGRPDIALYERVQNRLEGNQKFSSRNNQEPYNYLLRGGFIKCGYCGGNMTTTSVEDGRKGYRCSTKNAHDTRCVEYNTIYANTIDPLVWSYAVEIIRDPSKVDQSVEARKTADPNVDRRQYITEELAMVKAKQKRLRSRLEDEDLDDDTYTDVKRRLKELADLKGGYEKELTTEINVHEQWKKTQDQLNHFHQECDKYRERISDPNYKPDYSFQREAIKFFGIEVIAWKADHSPRFEIRSNPPSIVSSMS